MKNKVLHGWLLLIALTVLVTFVAVQNLNEVTVSGWEVRLTKRVSDLTVGEFLHFAGVQRLSQEAGAVLTDDYSKLNKKGKYLLCSMKLDEKITEDTTIGLEFFEVREVPALRDIPFKVIVRNTYQLPPGQKKILQRGKKGVRKEIYRVTYNDGALIKKEKIVSDVLSLPADQIVEKGAPMVKVSRSRTISSGKVKKGTFLFNSTAYTHTGYRTAAGIKPKRGVVAVDPRVIPLGTRLHVEGYGYAVAADTGGAIKGPKIDVFFETRSEAIRWGRRNVQVTILG